MERTATRIDVGTDNAKHLAAHPFDYQRRLASVLVEAAGARQVIVKGAPEIVLARCTELPASARKRCSMQQFAAGSRVIAVATRAGAGRTSLAEPRTSTASTLSGFLTFVDRPKADAHDALERLRRLDVEVKVITGDNDRVAQKVCADIGLAVRGTLTGTQLDDLDDAQLAAVLEQTTIFARVTPEQKSRLIKAQRALGSTVGFLGDGVNDAVALHDADVGISVQTATDVAKDAADIVLLDKDLEILAAGDRRGPADLRQHDQVRPDGHLVELREHVQRRWRVAVPELPADAADADPAQQPALRRERDDDPDRQRRRGAAAAPCALGHRISSAAS